MNMEPLVEVNNSGILRLWDGFVDFQDEMKLAIEVGAKVIGINNRNLHTFQVDLQTTTRLVQVSIISHLFVHESRKLRKGV